MSPLTPYLAVTDSRAAVQWYAEAFGAVVTYELVVMPDGRVGHVELDLLGGHVMMADAHPELQVVAPDPAGASVTLQADVPDVDAAVARAVAVGATLDRGPEDNPPIGRLAVLRDPFGHRWFLMARLPG